MISITFAKFVSSSNVNFCYLENFKNFYNHKNYITDKTLKIIVKKH